MITKENRTGGGWEAHIVLINREGDLDIMLDAKRMRSMGG
jgi:hypothetical protein